MRFNTSYWKTNGISRVHRGLKLTEIYITTSLQKEGNGRSGCFRSLLFPYNLMRVWGNLLEINYSTHTSLRREEKVFVGVNSLCHIKCQMNLGWNCATNHTLVKGRRKDHWLVVPTAVWERKLIVSYSNVLYCTVSAAQHDPFQV